MSKLKNRKPKSKCGPGKRYSKKKKMCVDTLATKMGVDTPLKKVAAAVVVGTGIAAYKKAKK